MMLYPAMNKLTEYIPNRYMMVNVVARRARQITQSDVDSYDYIYYMDASNLRFLHRLFPGETKFLPFLERGVADPYYSGDFTQTWADIWDGCSRIMEELA